MPEAILTDYDFTAFLASPLSLAVCAVVVVAALLASRMLLGQWNRHRVPASTRGKEATALVLATATALLLVIVVNAHFDKQDRDLRMMLEVEQKDALASELRSKITTEVDRVRAMLADRTVRRIEQQQLKQARDELARFQSLNDPQITQMLALIDSELEIRSLVAQALNETAPAKLFGIYSRLSALVPEHAQYKESAEHYAAAMKLDSAGKAAASVKSD